MFRAFDIITEGLGNNEDTGPKSGENFDDARTESSRAASHPRVHPPCPSGGRVSFRAMYCCARCRTKKVEARQAHEKRRTKRTRREQTTFCIRRPASREGNPEPSREETKRKVVWLGCWRGREAQVTRVVDLGARRQAGGLKAPPCGCRTFRNRTNRSRQTLSSASTWRSPHSALLHVS